MESLHAGPQRHSGRRRDRPQPVRALSRAAARVARAQGRERVPARQLRVQFVGAAALPVPLRARPADHGRRRLHAAGLHVHAAHARPRRRSRVRDDFGRHARERDAARTRGGGGEAARACESRRADGNREPALLRSAARRRIRALAALRRRSVGAAVRSRPLQDDQRPLRPCGRRRGAARDGAPRRVDRARAGYVRPLRRRGIRAAAPVHESRRGDARGRQGARCDRQCAGPCRRRERAGDGERRRRVREAGRADVRRARQRGRRRALSREAARPRSVGRVRVAGRAVRVRPFSFSRCRPARRPAPPAATRTASDCCRAGARASDCRARTRPLRR
ncbi:Diguanylate cyclase/phosphodiesterase domain 2 [Burkholderia dolosa AU0158]|nr:Diguanylate cyclase/phosphodiesterase domain 2 [Burkholderia dolosa AU0158]